MDEIPMRYNYKYLRNLRKIKLVNVKKGNAV